MCSSVPALRLAAFLLLLVAFLACCIGFLSPFWKEYHPSSSSSSSSSQSSEDSTSSSPPPFPTTTSSSPTPPSSSPSNQVQVKARNYTVPNSDATEVVAYQQKQTYEKEEEDAERKEGEEKKEMAVVNVTSGRRRMFEGLWLRCDEQFKCHCFAENNFQMEKEFPDWHKAAQGLFMTGLLFILITLVIGGCYLCCRCCKESVALATVLGSFALIGFLPIALSIVVYGGFANQTKGIEVVGDGDRFAWGYFLSIAGSLLILLAALLYFLDGRRKEVMEHEDCETAKMV